MPKFYWGFEYVAKGQKPIGMKYYGFAWGGLTVGYWKVPADIYKLFPKN